MTDEQNIRFGLGLNTNKPFVEAVFDAFDQSERIRVEQRKSFQDEIEKLREENRQYKQAYHDQWYNNREIERCWNEISQYNRNCLELHEAIREYIRNYEWHYEENPNNIKRDACTCWRSGYEGFPCTVHSKNANFPPNSTEQQIKGR